MGALIVEQIEDNRVAPAMAQRIEVVCRHSSVALANAMEHQSLFLMPLWRAIGKSRFIVQARTLPKTIMIAVAVVAVIVALFLCAGRLRLALPRERWSRSMRHDIFAGIDGEVYEFGKDADDRQADRTRLLGQEGPTLAEAPQSHLEGANGRDRRPGDHRNSNTSNDLRHELSGSDPVKPDERARLEGQLAEAEQKLISLEAQAEIQRSKVADLEVYSPIDGQIVTWDLKNRLEGRPVQKRPGPAPRRQSRGRLGTRSAHARRPHGPHRPGREDRRRPAPRAAAGHLHPGHGAGNER